MDNSCHRLIVKHNPMSSRTIKYYWEDDEQTILRINYAKDWNVRDYEIVMLETIEAIEDVQHGVYSINYFEGNLVPPSGFYPVLQRLYPRIPDNLVLTITVAGGPMLPLLQGLVKRLIPSILAKNRTVVSIEEAHRLIARHKRENAADSQ